MTFIVAYKLNQNVSIVCAEEIGILESYNLNLQLLKKSLVKTYYRKELIE